MATFVLIYDGGREAWDWHLVARQLAGRYDAGVPRLPDEGTRGDTRLLRHDSRHRDPYVAPLPVVAAAQ